MKKVLSIVILSLILVPALAMARDSVHLVCTGFMANEPGPDNYGIALHFDESRFHGDERMEVISAIWQGNLYQGKRVNSEDDFGKNGKIEMVDAMGKKEVYFKGSYNLVNKLSGYALQIKGKLNLDPSTTMEDAEAIDTELNCVDLSN